MSDLEVVWEGITQPDGWLTLSDTPPQPPVDPTTVRIEAVSRLFVQTEEPTDPQAGDLWLLPMT